MQLILLPFLIICLSFTEVLVFNEEVLLTLCFVGFIFYAYTSFGLSIQQNFIEQAEGFEVLLSNSFNSKFQTNLTSYYHLVFLTNLSSSIEIGRLISLI